MPAPALVLDNNEQQWRPIMDLFYFLKARKAFVRHFYTVTSAPFADIKHKIESGEAPLSRVWRSMRTSRHSRRSGSKPKGALNFSDAFAFRCYQLL
jgi:hypothetical protein